jgi:hypothetical protein
MLDGRTAVLVGAGERCRGLPDRGSDRPGGDAGGEGNGPSLLGTRAGAGEMVPHEEAVARGRSGGFPGAAGAGRAGKGQGDEDDEGGETDDEFHGVPPERALVLHERSIAATRLAMKPDATNRGLVRRTTAGGDEWQPGC